MTTPQLHTAREIRLARPAVPALAARARDVLSFEWIKLRSVRSNGWIAATIGVIYLVAVLCLVLPSPWNVRAGRFTLPFAAYQVVARHPQAGLFSPGVSLLVLIAWPAAILVTAGVLFTRRDL